MRKTKIIATISDRKCDAPFLEKLINAGVNIIRLNTAHQTLEDAAGVIKSVRSVSNDVAILVDTKGPEIRTKLIPEPIEIAKDEIVYLTGSDNVKIKEKLVHVSYESFQYDLNVGDRVFIDDGDIELIVMEKFPDKLRAVATNPGVIKNRKSINVPGTHLNLSTLNEKDKAFIGFAIENNIDFIAHSFVRNKEDVLTIQKILDEHNSQIKIIAKIENQDGVDNIEEILDHVYGVMVARGDLAIEIDAEKIPVIQRHIINKCQESKKPVIVATQMLQSMIEHPRPTRAEVSDIASAVSMGTDAVMLSGETAYGNYPLESVEMMAKIAEANELMVSPDSNRNLVRINNEVTAALARVAVRLTTILPIKAVILDTLSGRTARYLSAFRGGLPVYARCYEQRVVRELALSYGVFPYFTEKPQSRDDFMKDIPCMLLQEGYKKEDQIVIMGGSFGSVKGASFIEVCKIEDLLTERKDQECS